MQCCLLLVAGQVDVSAPIPCSCVLSGAYLEIGLLQQHQQHEAAAPSVQLLHFCAVRVEHKLVG